MLIIWFVASCGASEGNLVVATSFVLGERSGAGPSQLDVLEGQSIAFEVELADAVIGHESAQACRHTVSTSEMAVTSATGAQANVVETEILEKTIAWDLRLVLCEPTTDSYVALHTEGPGGIAVVAGCATVPASAQQRDDAGDPRFSNFTATGCDGTVYDPGHDRVFMAHGFTMTITHRSE